MVRAYLLRMDRQGKKYFSNGALAGKIMDVRREVSQRISIPENILTLQYVGAPLRSQVDPESRKRYATLRSLGPNDGLTLLPDELVEGGIAVTDIGLDHYYRDPKIDMKTLALTQLVIGALTDGDRVQLSGLSESR